MEKGRDGVRDMAAEVPLRFAKQCLRRLTALAWDQKDPPTRVYVQLDARQAFETVTAVDGARRMVERAEELGVPREKLVIKIPG
jgi:hypothetical protein